MSKLLLVNADDFGFTPDVNEGIVEANRNGILTATTLMANGDAFDDAVRLAGVTPALDIGCHLVLAGGKSLVTGRAYPRTVAELLRALATRQINPYDELRAQIRRILDAGIQPSHLDTHKHTHLAPPVLHAVARLSEEFGIRWVRRPFDFPLNAADVPAKTKLAGIAMNIVRPWFHHVLTKHGCRTTDHFAGFQITGRFRTEDLVALLGVIPEGTTELMTHPGRCRDALRNARTRLKESRELELEALLAPETRAALVRNQITLSDYRALSRAATS